MRTIGVIIGASKNILYDIDEAWEHNEGKTDNTYCFEFSSFSIAVYNLLIPVRYSMGFLFSVVDMGIADIYRGFGNSGCRAVYMENKII